MNLYTVTFTRNGDGIKQETILAADEQQVRNIFADCEVLRVELKQENYDQELESQINAARIWTSNILVTEADAKAIHNYIVAAEAGDAYIDRLNNSAGYDVFTAMATKTPERIAWEREYLAKRGQVRPLYEEGNSH